MKLEGKKVLVVGERAALLRQNCYWIKKLKLFSMMETKIWM